MNEIIQNLEANATNGKENFCFISEKQLLAMKKLSEKEKQENTILKQTLIDIREIVSGYDFKNYNYFKSRLIEDNNKVLQIIDKVLKKVFKR